MFVVFQDAKRSRQWQRIYADIDSGKTPSFDAVFQGYTAALDAPVEMVWQDILKANPNVKASHTPFS